MSNTSETPMTFEIRNLRNRVTALDNAITQMLKLDYDTTASVLIEIRDEIKQQIKDLEIDANTLPFPEK